MTTDYLKALTAHVAEYRGTLREIVELAPSYARLMFALLEDPRLSREHKLWVDAAIAYLVSPSDVIPEAEVGAYGYLDDIFCCAFVANRIAGELGWDLVEEGWTGRGTAHDASEELLAREHELLGHAGDDILRYAGLYEPLDAGDSRASSRG